MESNRTSAKATPTEIMKRILGYAVLEQDDIEEIPAEVRTTLLLIYALILYVATSALYFLGIHDRLDLFMLCAGIIAAGGLIIWTKAKVVNWLN